MVRQSKRLMKPYVGFLHDASARTSASSRAFPDSRVTAPVACTEDGFCATAPWRLLQARAICGLPHAVAVGFAYGAQPFDHIEAGLAEFCSQLLANTR